MGKEKKEKKSKRVIDDISLSVVENESQIVVEMKKSKKSRKSAAVTEDNKIQNAGESSKTESESVSPNTTNLLPKESPPPTVMAGYEKRLKNTLLTREERAARENQRQMQAYVLELRSKGVDEKEIEKLKKRAKSKMKHMKPNMKVSDILVGKTDKRLECRECGAEFIFSVREQHFYQEKNFAAPVRCKECYNAKKERMANFDKK